MKPICNFCKNQENSAIWKGEVRCGVCNYTMNEGYWPFKGGSVCIHDEDISDKFQPREDDRGEVVKLSKLLADQAKEISLQRYEIEVLRSRLVRI